MQVHCMYNIFNNTTNTSDRMKYICLMNSEKGTYKKINKNELDKNLTNNYDLFTKKVNIPSL